MTGPALLAADATVTSRCDDDCVCRLWVHAEDGTAAAHLVHDAVVEARARGRQGVAMTLDVASPACGDVLAELRDLAADGIGTLRVRRAGETVLVDLDLRTAP